MQALSDNSLQDVSIRIKKLHQLIHGSTPIDKANLKKDAWLAKGFTVLIKRNFTKGRLTTSYSKFAMLLSVLGGHDPETDEEPLKNSASLGVKKYFPGRGACLLGFGIKSCRKGGRVVDRGSSTGSLDVSNENDGMRPAREPAPEPHAISDDEGPPVYMGSNAPPEPRPEPVDFINDSDSELWMGELIPGTGMEEEQENQIAVKDELVEEPETEGKSDDDVMAEQPSSSRFHSGFRARSCHIKPFNPVN